MWVCPSFSLVVYLFYCLFVVDFNSFKSPLFSTDPDEEMDTSPLAKPFFTIDKEGDADGGGEGKQEEEASDSGEEEEPDRQGEEQEDEEDDDVSVTQKTSSNGGGANGNHGAESEESSDEEEEEQQEEANKRLCVAPAAARCQTVAS